MLITLYKIGECTFACVARMLFMHVKSKNKDLLLQARVVVRTSNMIITHRRLPDYVKTLHQKKRAARAARLFFFIQLIKSLICGVFVDVDVAVVKS